MKKLGTFGLTLAATLAIVACGGDDEEGGEPVQAGDPPEATESLEEFTQVFEDAIAKVEQGDCKDYESLFANPLELSCEGLQELTKEDPLTIEGTEEFGPVALMEASAEKEGESTFALASAYDGKWRIVQQYIPAPGDEPLEEEATTEVAETYVEAIRQKDCDTFLDNVNLGTATAEEACASIEEGPAAEAFQSTETEVQSLGGNEFIRMYGISLEEEGWFNFFILDRNGDPTVLDINWMTHPDSPSAPEEPADEPEEK